ncbi:SecY-interacting protein [Brenneria goodwinii]|uniref:Protein Syd n=1 Tax=Brenneria goodwinii TaxID=1109412 RepID=A0A0G4JQ40_9GAMM|nr:SecY-interacting protein [Brenneria goodwinii]ATA25053.1 secretion protein [Brenneria goodwinii]MCG8155482.1 SecY-interacting protein [Brenneria goodwinii]MCG8160491.1 SecY-interacting protein [Brenneria goodwinii]MCG8165014.1 SecY-interacting protein [Brenneria goodwinii]MCG8169329.1 SecY-interacting protein [Brenneria goodwinii]
MAYEVPQALAAFTQRYVELWRRETGHPPASEALYGVPSPCITQSQSGEVFWLPQPFLPAAALDGVERALDISLHPDIHAFYTTQYAGDMAAQFESVSCVLLQTWSEDDFSRMQENLIGHLLTQKRLKLPPTLFLATTDSEMTMISLCNVSGQVLLEEFGTKKHRVLAATLADFLSQLSPVFI